MKKLKTPSIVTVVKDYAGMQIPEKGGNFECLLHDDSSKDSMRYYPESNTVHCFGACQKTYNPAQYVAAYKGIEMKEAYKELETRYGIERVSAEELLNEVQQELIRKLVENAKVHLQEDHKAYLRERGLTDEKVDELCIGYLSEDIIEDSGLLENELIAMGIITNSSEGEFSTNFAEKIIIPVYQNKILVSVLAWNIKNLDGEPKYSLPKGKEKPLIGDLKSGAIIVEGYFDMVSLQLSGYDAIATLGAGVTKTQLIELKKYKNLTIMFDGDEAGSEGSEKIARELYPNARIAYLPEDEDPNSMLVEKKHAKFKTAIEKAIAESRDFITEELEKAEEFGSQREAAKYIGEYVVPLICKLGDLEQESVVSDIASNKKAFGITKSTIKKEVQNCKKENTNEEVTEGNQAMKVFEELREEIDLLKDENGGVMVKFTLSEKSEIVSVNSETFKRFVRVKTQRMTGKIPSTDLINGVIATFESVGYFEGQQTKLENRIAEEMGKFYYDMRDDASSVVEITPQGWNVIETSKPLFLQEEHQKAQVVPDRDGDIDHIFQLFKNLSEKQKMLLKVILVCAFIPNIPKPILYVLAERGSGKSKLTKALRQLIDPSRIDSLKEPRVEDRVVQQLKHHMVGLFDNINNMHDWFIRLCCTAVTGECDERRALYTNEGSIIFSFKRFLIINAINRLGINYTDFQERLYILKLKRISEEERMEEKEFDRIFEAIKPKVLGGIFDTLSKAMSIKPTLTFEKLPRMADFASYGSAVAIALGYTQKEFLAAYNENLQEANTELIGDNPITFAISEFMVGRNYWKGKASELLTLLDEVAIDNRIDTKEKVWPKSPAALSMRLNTVLTNLRDIGINIIRDKDTGSNASRYIEINRNEVNCVIEDNSDSNSVTSGSI